MAKNSKAVAMPKAGSLVLIKKGPFAGSVVTVVSYEKYAAHHARSLKKNPTLGEVDTDGARKVFYRSGKTWGMQLRSTVVEVQATKDKPAKGKKAKFTPEQMGQAFLNVSSKKSWKEPIKAKIANPGKRNLACLEASIIHFTGSAPSFKHVGDQVVVRAAGYNASICG